MASTGLEIVVVSATLAVLSILVLSISTGDSISAVIFIRTTVTDFWFRPMPFRPMCTVVTSTTQACG